MAFLVEKCHNKDGSFSDQSHLKAVHTIYTILVLQSARRRQLNPYGNVETEAIEWLLEHPDEARKLVEEKITIDSSGRADYGFLFMTDALLIKVLAGSAKSEHRDSELARQAMSSLRDKMDESGGFYGYRVFSWATAKALSALGVATSQYQEFPKRRPEYPGRRVGHFIFGFALFLAILVLVLTMNDRFEVLQAGIFVVLMLCTLVAYESIGEKTFKELSHAVLNPLKKE